MLNLPLAINRSQFRIVSIHFWVISNCCTTSTISNLSNVNDFSSTVLSFFFFFLDPHETAASGPVVGVDHL